MKIDISYIDWQIPFFFNWKPGVKYKTCRKGRRAAVTHGAAHAIIEWLLDGTAPILWGETTHGNIERYYERYFKPTLDNNKIVHHFDRQAKKLTIGKNYCDFRSADNPENWEGFGYKIIFLNEAGIILKNRSLYINSVLPMLLDYDDSKLIAAGVPKGKLLKDGTEHPFWTLCKRAESGLAQYEMLHLSSYDNPLLSEQDIKDLETEIEVFSPEQVRQEIYGEFIEMDALNPFAHKYDATRHESLEVRFDPRKQITISIDFNLNPFAVTFSHLWKDANAIHDHQFNELGIANGSIPEMGDQIWELYHPWLGAAQMTGDYSGNNDDLSKRDHASFFLQLLRRLGMSQSQLRIKKNPLHINSRADVNYVLMHHPDYKINPVTCPNTCRDMRVVQCDAFGQIIKKNRKDLNQRADFIDTVRNKIDVFWKPWILSHQKQNKPNDNLHAIIKN